VDWPVRPRGRPLREEGTPADAVKSFQPQGIHVQINGSVPIRLSTGVPPVLHGVPMRELIYDRRCRFLFSCLMTPSSILIFQNKGLFA